MFKVLKSLGLHGQHEALRFLLISILIYYGKSGTV